jgi:hypothetical protein
MPTTTAPAPPNRIPRKLILGISIGRICVKTSFTSEWDFEKIPSSNVGQVTQLLDGTILIVNSDNGKIEFKK